MTCDWVREHIPECLAGTLEKSARAVVVEHVETCSGCRAELGELGVVWRGLETRSLPEPDASMRARFREMLQVYQDAYQAGRQAAGQTPAVPSARVRRAWWLANPIWKLAGAFALLVAGVVCGRYLDRRYFDTSAGESSRNAGQELALLRGQVEGLRQLVALSLLNEPSPSSRLRGVTYSEQIAQPDAQIVQALLRTLNHDPNVNVRLRVVDALEKYCGDPQVRRALVDAISVQDTQLVQIALIDLLGQIRDREAAPVLRRLSADSQTDETVRQRAAMALEKIDSPEGAIPK
jgi:hypothetical protein